jgi:pyruvate, water dikinase
MGWLKRIFQSREGSSSVAQAEKNMEELRQRFRSRLNEFQLLLAANNQALEAMTELETALAGDQPFGMAFVRSRTTAATAAVLRIIRHLDALAPGKYAALYSVFKSIQEDIAAVLAPHAPRTGGPRVLRLDQLTPDMVDLAGSKATRLAEVATVVGMDVPPGFVVTAEGYRHFLAASRLEEEINRRIQAADPHDTDQFYALSSSIQRLVLDAPLPEDLAADIQSAVADLVRSCGPDTSLAVRSSALTEDLEGASFAGQYLTVLNVAPDQVPEAYKEVAASLFSAQAMLYHLRLGIAHEDTAMCVACLHMIRPRSSGVLYTCNPVDIQDETMLVHSVWGLPRAVVDGLVTPDALLLSREDPPTMLSCQVADKAVRFDCSDTSGVSRAETTAAERRSCSLSEAEAVRLGAMAMTLERHYGRPQDIEWAVDQDGNVIILQCRPLHRMSPERKAAAGRVSQPPQAPVLYEGGVTAASGTAAGAVFHLTRQADALRFPQGCVLVTPQALPRWAPLLHKAAAVVAEQGASASHLANVAREMGVPALFGAVGAMDALQQGAEVTVDADASRVYAGALPGLEDRKPQPRPLTDTPVHRILKRVAALVVPLNLLDPDSPDFSPTNCRTLHDITRYCHEQSVHEMFSFGREHDYQEGMGKQLVCDVPMQWWVLNLDDGFLREEEGNYVHLENIASIPMLALWQGIVAVPWRGPPELSGSGLLSVMFQASSNPALAPGAMGSPYTQRNYFMISRNYCCLSSRLGFHFTTVEAFVGERIFENSIRFHFKGGAADQDRRLLRLRLLAEILESQGFRTDIHKDRLAAALDNGEREFLEARLRVLGYLIMHARQIDMVMADPAKASQYRRRFEADIEALTGPR